MWRAPAVSALGMNHRVRACNNSRTALSCSPGSLPFLLIPGKRAELQPNEPSSMGEGGRATQSCAARARSGQKCPKNRWWECSCRSLNSTEQSCGGASLVELASPKLFLTKQFQSTPPHRCYCCQRGNSKQNNDFHDIFPLEGENW